MSVTSNIRKAGPYTGNGITTAYPFTFKVFNASEVFVVQADTSGNETALALTADYTVTLNANQDANPGGTVNMLLAPAVGITITLTSSVDATQSLTLTNQGGFYPSVVNDALDRLTIIAQQIRRDADRAVKVPLSSSQTGDAFYQALLNASDSAAASDASALNSLNEFKGRSYGPLPADPVLDPLGNAMVSGDEYFNTTSNRKRVYDGLAWNNYEDAAVSAAAAALADRLLADADAVQTGLDVVATAAAAADAQASAGVFVTAASSGVVGFATLALLQADLAPADRTIAYVTNDGVNNGIYRKVGATGAGSWTAGSSAVTEGNCLGIAAPATNPPVQSPTQRDFYFTSSEGTYTNFSGLVVGKEIAALRWTGTAWVKDTLYDLSVPDAIRIGSVVSGAIYPVTPTGANNRALTVAPGTVVSAVDGELVNVTAGQTVEWSSVNAASKGYVYVTSAGMISVDAVTPMLSGGVRIATHGTQYAASVPLLPSNHFIGGTAGAFSATPIPFETLNIKSFGVVGDGVADDSWVLPILAILSRFYFSSQWQSYKYYKKSIPPFTVYFPAGTYLIDGLGGNHDWKFIGDGKTTTLIKSFSQAAFAWAKSAPAFLEDIGFEDVPGISNTTTVIDWKNVKFTWTAAATGGATYCAYGGIGRGRIIDVDFDYQGVCYAGLWLYNFDEIEIKGCTFATSGTGHARHCLRLASPLTTHSKASVTDCTFNNGTTGIFLGSDRVMPFRNIRVERNVLNNQDEESIAFDGFGNRTTLCPVICNGTITIPTNDVTGKLVINAAMIYTTDGINASPSPVSLRTDWKNFYFSLDEGSGREGVVVPIVAFDAVADTFTLDCYTPAASITVGGRCGVQSGFFNCIVRDNVITGSVGASNTYAAAMSIYLNVFNFTITGNTVVGCAVGLNLHGGLMLNHYRTHAYNNIVSGNRFLNCNQVAGATTKAAISFRSMYDISVEHYGNHFVNNTVQGGELMRMHMQKNFVFEGNAITNVNQFEWKGCGNVLPPANATNVGQRFMLITDDPVSLLPTDISYHVCKLTAGAYAWSVL